MIVTAWLSRLFSTIAVCPDTLVLAEKTIGKWLPLRSDLERAVRELTKINILAAQILRQVVPFEDDLLAIVRHRELFADVALCTMT